MMTNDSGNSSEMGMTPGMDMRPPVLDMGTPTGQDMDDDPDMMNTPGGTLLSQAIISDNFGSPSTEPKLVALSPTSLYAFVQREPGTQAQDIDGFEYSSGMWQAETRFADAMARNATDVWADSPNQGGQGIIYRSVGEQSYYYATFNGAQWDGDEILGISFTDASLEAMSLGGASGETPAFVMRRNLDGAADQLVTAVRTGPTSWEEAYSVTTRNADWSIDEANLTLDEEGKIHAVFLESKSDPTFTGGKDTQITYVDPDDSSMVDIARGGAYERRPSIIQSVNGRMHVFYRQSDTLTAFPLNTKPYDLFTRVREPGSKVWSEPLELRRQMNYYKVLAAPNDSLVLIGIDPAGDFFIRTYRNRSWNNLQTIKTDFKATTRSNLETHMDAAIYDRGILHVIYRTDNTASLAYFTYRL